jgi:hypothetical protein
VTQQNPSTAKVKKNIKRGHHTWQCASQSMSHRDANKKQIQKQSVDGEEHNSKSPKQISMNVQ